MEKWKEEGEEEGRLDRYDWFWQLRKNATGPTGSDRTTGRNYACDLLSTSLTFLPLVPATFCHVLPKTAFPLASPSHFTDDQVGRGQRFSAFKTFPFLLACFKIR